MWHAVSSSAGECGLKILSGSARGARLLTGSASGTRPLTGRARTSLFDIIQPRLGGCRFLDLFAGFGSVGLEAVSRGALRTVLVERDRMAAQLIQRNIEKLHFGERAEVWQMDAFRAVETLARAGEQFGIVFAGPPYGQGLAQAILKTAELPRILAAGAWVVVQHDRRDDPGAGGNTFQRLRQERYGATLLSFYPLSQPDRFV
jgi:16S rRNA (guanine(966)-N(2))-methyltransferase RsmD